MSKARSWGELLKPDAVAAAKTQRKGRYVPQNMQNTMNMVFSDFP